MAVVPEEMLYGYASAQDYQQEAVLKHLPLVKTLARSLAASTRFTVEVDEMVSYGVFGLMSALKRFQPSRGVKFETYATTLIRGAMLDGLRAMDSVPVVARRRAKKVARAVSDLEGRFGRSPSDREIASELGVDLKSYHGLASEAMRCSTISLQALAVDEDRLSTTPVVSLEDRRNAHDLDPQAVVEAEDVKRQVSGAVGDLPPKERTVISLHYYEGLKVKDIARIMKISRPRVSQLHRRALERLERLLVEL
ncbi:MAG: FliA/WhiG family RNA polymerase sigma factor [Bacillota bacterium]|nr:FliA/WhiG family RNA polymerase sigma factor [Bacillota bacterium]